jgi:hypothetical protein
MTSAILVDDAHPRTCLLCIPSVAHSVWTALDQCNTSLGQTLARLTELYDRDEYAYVETVRWAAGLQPRQVRHDYLTFCAGSGRLTVCRSGSPTLTCHKRNQRASKSFTKPIC